MDTYYSSERNVQILVSLMKAHGIRKVIASPGTTNICFVASLQCDPYFELYSSADERSAAYMACGLAAESGEPVVLSCTGATASRNYIPGLTEAFYRKLPVLAVTATQHTGRIGQNIAQVIDRRNQLNDMVKESAYLPVPHNDEDAWDCNVKCNKALLELRHRGGGPVHINLMTTYSKDFSVKELPEARVINRIAYGDKLPELPKGKVGIFVGAHRKWDDALMQAVDKFCSTHDAVVLCDHTSNYKGNYRVLAPLVCSQEKYISQNKKMDVLIHIGDVSGGYMGFNAQEIWRVNPDGEIRDTFRKLRYVFEMEEWDFFNMYVNEELSEGKEDFLIQWKDEDKRIRAKVPDDLPFSNPWIASKTAGRIPENSVVHFGILNSLRTWNFFEMTESVLGYSNTGGFGIDGCVSSLIGASLAEPQKLYFGIVGDLAFFYDMNVLGNRHIGSNVRLMVVNNGCGTEFKNYNHPAARFGEDANYYMAAVGHYGNGSRNLLKHYVEDLGFTYLCAENKDEYLANMEYFVSPENYESPIVFEVFTTDKDESEALRIINNLEISTTGMAKKMIKEVFGEKGVQAVKKIVKP